MLDATAPLDVREDERFQADQRDVEAALVHARRFAQKERFETRQEANEAADAIKALKDVVKAADGRKRAITKPARDFASQVNAQYKELLAQPEAAIQVLTRKGVEYAAAERRRQEEERKAEQERLDKEAEEKAAAAQKAAEEAEAEPTSSEAQRKAAEAHQQAAVAAVAEPRAKAEPKSLRGDFASLGTRTDYRFQVVDVDKVPDEYMTVNEKSVKAAIKAEKGMAKAQGRPFNLELIPGVRIWAEDVGVSR